jgi:hypothetical protein
MPWEQAAAKNSDCSTSKVDELLRTLKKAEDIVNWVKEASNDQTRWKELREVYECFRCESDPNKTAKQFPQLFSKGKVSLTAQTILALYLAAKKDLPIAKKLLDKLNERDNQHARHLRRRGFKIRSIRQNGETFYKLSSIQIGMAAQHRKTGHLGNFESIKAKYQNRCATCGAEEGKPHWNPYYAESGEPVRLQKGHMNPHHPLDEGNVIPQCQFCNKLYRNWLVFDVNGRVIGVASWQFVVKSLKEKYLQDEPPTEFLTWLRSKLDKLEEK